MQRILIISVVVILLAAGGAAAFYFYFSKQPGLAVTTPTSTSTLPISGGTTSPVSSTTEPTPPIEVPNPTKTGERLVQISKGPVVAGVIAYSASTTASKDEVGVSFIERQSGNVYQYLVKSGVLTRTSNKTIPGIQEALWKGDGSLAFVRYLSGDTDTTINTYALPSSGGKGYFLTQNIASISINGNALLTLASGGNGSVGSVSKLDGSNSKKAFTTPLSALRTSYLGATQYLAFTKPSATLPGFAYLVNSTGNFERILGPLPGLVALASPSGKWVLFSYTSNGILKMALYEVATRKSLSLPVATIVDKCTWTNDDRCIYCGVPKEPSSNFAYPDDWYQGAVSFSDRIWKVDVGGRFAELTLDFQKDAKQALDATTLAVDPKNSVLVFRNKIDASLWGYQL